MLPNHPSTSEILKMLRTLTPLAAAIVLMSAGHAATQPIGVALITTTTDIQEKHLAPFIASESVEGFAGSHGGWNFIDNSPQVMTEAQKQVLSEKSKDVDRLYSLERQYGASDNWDGLEKAIKAEKLTDVDDALGGLTYGTHMASIVARFSKNADLRLHILAVPEDESTAAKALARQLDKDVAKGATVFDNETTARKFATYLGMTNNDDFLAGIDNYIQKSRVRIVKAEFATSTLHFRTDIDKQFDEQTGKSGKKPTAEQKKNMELAHSLALQHAEQSWCSLPRDNPNVLFMFPAAHTGKLKNVANAGDADANVSFPAGCERTSPNVLTNTSVNDDGTLVQSSDYGKSIDIAGVNKQSGFAPNGFEVTGGGTCPVGSALTGVAAAIWSEHPEYTVAQVKVAVLALGIPLKSLESHVATGKYITRETLNGYDRFSKTQPANTTSIVQPAQNGSN
jgi:hypothetical protein